MKKHLSLLFTLIAFSAPFIASAQQKITDPFVKQSIGSTKEGVSQEVLNEYQAIIDAATKRTKGADHELVTAFTEEERAKLEAIFVKMSPEQQMKQRVLFVKAPKPLGKQSPSEAQFESFKKANVYGVWIDGIKVTNSELNKYTAGDFDQVFISKLHGAAAKGKTYTHQVDLMTKSYYAAYVKEASKDKKAYLMVRRGIPNV